MTITDASCNSEVSIAFLGVAKIRSRTELIHVYFVDVVEVSLDGLYKCTNLSVWLRTSSLNLNFDGQ